MCSVLKVLSLLVNGVTTPDATTLANVATALCRCTYEARNHVRLVTEFNTAQALCYIMQRQSANLKVRSLLGRLYTPGGRNSRNRTIFLRDAKLFVCRLLTYRVSK